MRQITLLLLLCCFLFALAGCQTAGGTGPIGDIFRILFSSVTTEDGEWTGVVTGPCESVAEPLLAQMCVLPLSLPHDPLPRQVLCTGEFRGRCLAATTHDIVDFVGSKIGPLYHPKSLKVRKAQT